MQKVFADKPPQLYHLKCINELINVLIGQVERASLLMKLNVKHIHELHRSFASSFQTVSNTAVNVL